MMQPLYKRSFRYVLLCWALLISDALRAEQELVFAIHPYITPSLLVERFQPMADYLSLQLKRPVRLHIASSMEDQTRRIVSGEVDLAYMSPTAYLRAHDRYASERDKRVQLVVGEEPYRSVIVVREDSPIRSLADLKGKTFAFVSHQSMGGHYMPRVQMANAGITLADLMDYGFLGRHERVVLSVLHGDYDAGSTSQGIAENYLARMPGLRVLDTSPPLPPLSVVARPGFPMEEVNRIREALANPDDAGREVLMGVSSEMRFRLIDDDEFDYARRLIESVERGSAGAR